MGKGFMRSATRIATATSKHTRELKRIRFFQGRNAHEAKQRNVWRKDANCQTEKDLKSRALAPRSHSSGESRRKSSGDIPSDSPRKMPMDPPTCVARRNDGCRRCASESGGGSNPRLWIARSARPWTWIPMVPEHTPPRPAAAIADRFKAAPTVRSMASPDRIMTELSKKPKATKGIAVFSAVSANSRRERPQRSAKTWRTQFL
mmetsp:Transcript_10326/g.31954  ORF Transcript_10326/g.31954 Transcript_10326/m.31954 type:complete len:204 (-) Transcript_10326:1111-1722(-)